MVAKAAAAKDPTGARAALVAMKATGTIPIVFTSSELARVREEFLSRSVNQAETLETNNPDIVVKRVYCVDYGLGGVLVNKGDKPFRGSLAVAVKDEDGDVVGRGTQRLRVSATNGARFAYYYINTLDCRKHSFDFTVK